MKSKQNNVCIDALPSTSALFQLGDCSITPSLNCISSFQHHLTRCVILVFSVIQVCVFSLIGKKMEFAARIISVAPWKEPLCGVPLPQGSGLKTPEPEGEMSLWCFSVKWAVWFFIFFFNEYFKKTGSMNETLKEHPKSVATIRAVKFQLPLLAFKVPSNKRWPQREGLCCGTASVPSLRPVSLCTCTRVYMYTDSHI